MSAKPFNLRDIRLLNGIFKDAMERDLTYLLQLDVDRLLYSFRTLAGITTEAKPYGGWEGPEVDLRGHFVGHYISACALMYGSTGDERMKSRVDVLVAELAKCQAALPAQGYNPGYLSAFPEVLFDRVERRDPAWAPYYTMHKIMAGLLDAYTECGNAQALAVLEALAGWVKIRVDAMTYEQMQINLLMEFGGMNDVLAALYEVTRNPEHLRLSLAFNDDLILDPLASGVDLLDRQHANTQIPKIIGTARQYELTGEQRLHDITRYFWQRVAGYRSFVIGGNSDDELFFPVNKAAEHLTPVSAETCNTYNMLKLTRHLFAWEPSALPMDFYERGLLNHILASQDPHTGMMLYFASLKPGHFKVYSSPEHSFWCCTGTGVENHAKYGDTIYFYDDDMLYVNLFIASELTWQEKGLTVQQVTQFPEEDTTRLTLHCIAPVPLKISIRYPYWANGAYVTVNGEAQRVDARAGSYITVEREWCDSDVIEVRLPMTLHTETLPGTPDRIAVLYGPVVLAAALGSENMPDVYSKDSGPRDSVIHDWPGPDVPVLRGSAQDMLKSIKPTDKPLTFQLSGVGLSNEVTLMAYYKLHHQRYTVYWCLA